MSNQILDHNPEPETESRETAAQHAKSVAKGGSIITFVVLILIMVVGSIFAGIQLQLKAIMQIVGFALVMWPIFWVFGWVIAKIGDFFHP